MALGKINSTCVVERSVHLWTLRSSKRRRLFRRIADATKDGEQEEERSDGGTKPFVCCATTRKRRRGVDDKGDHTKTWYAPPGTALDDLMLHLHPGGVACTARLTSPSYWDSLSLPVHDITIQPWCGASTGGLHPGVLECDEATRLVELLNTLERKLFFLGVIDFRVSM